MKSILAFLLFTCINLYGQNSSSVKFEWNSDYPVIDSLNNYLFMDATNSYLTDDSKNTAVDKDGNLYLLVSIKSDDYPNYTFKLIKYNRSGIFLWQVQSKDIDPYNYVADILKIDNTGDIYVAAHSFENNLPGGMYILKFNSEGTSLWTDKYNGSLINSVSSPIEIKFDNNENVILTGYAGRIENKDVKNDSLLIIKYNKSGGEEWSAETNNDSIIYRMHCQIDNSNNIIVAGESNNISNKVRIAKYNDQGENIWSSFWPDSNDYCITKDLTYDSDGNCYIIGNSFLSSDSKWVTIMFDKDGKWKWSKYIDRNSSSVVYEAPWLVSIDNNNLINVLGYENKNNISTFFLVKYDTNGVKTSERSFIDTTAGYIPGVLLYNSGNLYTAGFSRNPDKIYLVKFDGQSDKSWNRSFLSGGIKDFNSINLFFDNSGYIYITAEDSSRKTGVHEVVTSKYNSGGQEVWTARSNEYLGHQVTSMYIDNYGNTYLTGWLENGRDNNKDFFTIMYDSLGKIIWMNRFDGPAHSSDIPKAITKDNEGNIYITGASQGNLNMDFVTIKYNIHGEEEWTPPPRFDGGGTDIPQAIAVDSEGNVFVSGSSMGADSNYDFVTVKYNKFGQFQWKSRKDDSINGKDSVVSLAIDNLGNIYVAGTSDSTMSLSSFLIIKYDPSGTVLWTKRYHQKGNNWEKAAKMIIDKKNNIYITGTRYTKDTKEDIITVKYNSGGVFKWMSWWDDPGSLSDAASDIKVDKDGNVYVAGYGAGGGTGNDFVVIKYDSSGGKKWAATYDGPQSSDDFATSLALDYQENSYVAGYSLYNNNYEYSLVKFDTMGIKLWDQNYEYSASSNSIPVNINVDNSGNIVIGGYSGNSGWSVFNLIKYSQPGFIPTGISETLKNSDRYKLYQNYPNPFNPVTYIRYSIPKASFVIIKLYDILGREISTLISKEENAGSYELKLDSSNLSSGVYFYQMSVGNFSESKKLIILK